MSQPQEVSLVQSESISERYIYRDFKKGIFLIAVCVFNIALFLAMALTSRSTHLTSALMLMVVFFIVLFLLSVAPFLPGNNYLKLTPEGFIVRTRFQSRLRKWRDVEDFVLVQSGLIKKIAFAYTEEYKLRHPRNPISKLLWTYDGCDGYIVSNYNIPPEQLLSLLQEWQQRYAPQPETFLRKKLDSRAITAKHWIAIALIFNFIVVKDVLVKPLILAVSKPVSITFTNQTHETLAYIRIGTSNLRYEKYHLGPGKSFKIQSRGFGTSALRIAYKNHTGYSCNSYGSRHWPGMVLKFELASDGRVKPDQQMNHTGVPDKTELIGKPCSEDEQI